MAKSESARTCWRPLLLPFALVLLLLSCDQAHAAPDSKPPWAYGGVLPTWATAALTGGGPSFNVISYGASGNGVSDDTASFRAAFAAACANTSASGKRAEVLVPAGRTFYVKPFVAAATSSVSNSCSRITFRILGTIVTPPTPAEMGAWAAKKGLLHFQYFFDLAVVGSGTINGRGQKFWAAKAKAPRLLSFFRCENVIVSAIKVIDAPGKFIFFESSSNVMAQDVAITADSRFGADGFFLLDVNWAWLNRNSVTTGLDCVVLMGNANLLVENGRCGVSTNGISVGVLSNKAGTAIACVRDILVRNIVFFKSTYAARVKSWPKGQGCAKNIIYRNLTMVDVTATPVIITQFYQCPTLDCPTLGRGVAFKDVTMEDIKGTYTGKMGLDVSCIPEVPCTGITLSKIDLKSAAGGAPKAKCFNGYGKQSGLAPACLLPPTTLPALGAAGIKAQAAKCP